MLRPNDLIRKIDKTARLNRPNFRRLAVVLVIRKHMKTLVSFYKYYSYGPVSVCLI